MSAQLDASNTEQQAQRREVGVQDICSECITE